MAKFKAIVFAGLVVLSVAGCNKTNEGVATPPQHWKDSDIRIETHPNPPIAGMSEIVVIVTGAHGRPTHDLIISLRSSDSMPWVQAIQDGQIGVYRRAVDIKVSTGNDAILQVRIQHGEEQKDLLFPLKLVAE